jgi:hypothetical protein
VFLKIKHDNTSSLNMLLTNSMELSTYLETKDGSATEHIRQNIYNCKIQYNVDVTPSLVPSLSQMDTALTTP